MDQGELTSIFCARPQNFAWFLGAGASRTAGLPTATDILWDMKRRFYCREENQEISRQDIQNDAIKDRIQSYMESRGFPQQWADSEYPTYFEKIFGTDRERQRTYIRAILSEEKVTLSVGNRVLAALIGSVLCRIVFTTNFDSVVEKAVAEVTGRSIAAFHLEGPHAANQALNNEEYPIYCKLHGDFRYDSLKNLPDDLARQNEALAECLTNAASRFGFIVAGYSGRDESIMALFRSALDRDNAFPHGLFWLGIKGSSIPPTVEQLLDLARTKGIRAEYIPIETFDALLLRLWRNIEGKAAQLDAKVRKAQTASVNIPLPPVGGQKPLLRLNGLPIIAMPRQCLELSFTRPKDWDDLRKARHDSENTVFLTKADSVSCWGSRERIKQVFGNELSGVAVRDFPTNFKTPENLHFKGLAEEALCAAMARGKPLLSRTTRSSSYLVADPHAQDKSPLDPLHGIVGKVSGTIAGLFAPATDDHPTVEQVTWSEAVRLSIDFRAGQHWVLLDPDIWIWPLRARKIADEFLDGRRSDRYNKKFNTLLDVWIALVLGTTERNAEVVLSAFDEGSDAENPSFRIATRTAFSRRLAS
jgi:hypothetical protein